MNTQETKLNRILEIIGRIAETTADGDFIYRGEPEYYEPEHPPENIYRRFQSRNAAEGGCLPNRSISTEQQKGDVKHAGTNKSGIL